MTGPPRSPPGGAFPFLLVLSLLGAEVALLECDEVPLFPGPEVSLSLGVDLTLLLPAALSLALPLPFLVDLENDPNVSVPLVPLI